MKVYHPIWKAIIAFLLFTFILSFVQGINIQGKILNEDNEPISGVNIYDGVIGTTSQSNGSFSLNVDEDAQITFSHIGYTDVTIAAIDINELIQLNTTKLFVQSIMVKGGLQHISLLKSPSSISVIGKTSLKGESSTHFQGLTHSIPNMNWAGGTSRPRYFQIRGIGERSLYIGEGAPNFSVGFVIDDIDFSGIGMPAMLLDMNQIEIFQGPQSFIYGANAMAGLISMHTNKPSGEFEGKVQAGVATDNGMNLGIVFNSPIVENLNTRFTIYSGKEDGFRNNVFENTTNSNGKIEIMIRNKTLWSPKNNIQVELTSLFTDQDNKYDVWAPDNNKAFNTYSDNGGKDSQKSQAYSLRSQFQDISGFELTAITSYSKNESEHSYDGDWGNSDFWAEAPYNFDAGVEGWAYDFFDKTLRERNTMTQELRLSKNIHAHASIIAGVYVKSLTEKDDASGYLFSGNATTFKGSFDVNNVAGYFQFKHLIKQYMTASINIRIEQNKIFYTGAGDNYGNFIPEVDEASSHILPGFKSSLLFNINETAMVFGSLSRGYKSGGINQNPYLSSINRIYQPEYNWNYETGYKCFTPMYQFQFTAFYMNREDQQVNISSQQEEGNPNSFYFYTENAVNGNNSGFELDVSYQVNEALSLNMNMGYLRTHVDAYEYQTDATTAMTLGDRDHAQAPSYTYSVGFNYDLPLGLMLGMEITGKDEFYFSDSHDMKSEAYQLLNLSFRYTYKKLTINFWGKNIADERYATRGFYFGLEPPEYEDTLYLHWGDPRQCGLSVQYGF